MNRAIELALRTWYPKDHPLHYELHHPLGKLVGEWGELLDDYMKSIYKPGYEFNPKDELVDIWYYIRILSHQAEINPEIVQIIDTCKMDQLINRAIEVASGSFNFLFDEELNIMPIVPYTINNSYSTLNRICTLSNLTIDQLTEASWEKLKPGSERGEEWMKASQNE